VSTLLVSLNKKSHEQKKSMPVTTGQADNFRKVANEKRLGRGRFQRALDDGRCARFIDSLKSDYIPLTDERISELTLKAEALDGRIHIVRRVPVNQSGDWQEALQSFQCQIPIDHEVRSPMISCQYPTSQEGVVEKDIVLLEISGSDTSRRDHSRTYGEIMIWSKSVSLKKTNPRELFAVGSIKFDLNKMLNRQGFLSVVCTTAFRTNYTIPVDPNYFYDILVCCIDSGGCIFKPTIRHISNVSAKAFLYAFCD
jgi:hypothetical protein